MPLLRFAVRNEYGLGQPELYKDANKEDPKAVLDGVAVAGLVGILRQLGDLAEFAAEVFHGLQEQVMSTSSRSHKLTIRVQHLEAALPPLEKAVLAQTSHIHFAYTAGSEWHPHIRNEQNHFICNDLPRFVMDSYEECRNPPRMHLLDKFDAGGPGSCLNRYSDPAFFRRVSDSTIEKTAHRIQLEKKARKKKKRSSHRNGELSRVTSISNLNGSREHFTSAGIIGRTSSQTAYTLDGTLKSDPGDHSMSFDLRPGSGYSECIFNRGSSLAPGEQGSKESSSMVRQQIDTPESSFCDESTHMVDDRQCSSSPERALPGSSCVTWDEKAEIVEPKGQRCDNVEVPEVLSSYFDVDRRDRGTARNQKVDEMDILLTREPVEALSGNLDIDTQEGINVHHRHADQMDILLDIESQEVLSAKSDIDTQDSETSILRNIDDMHIFPASKDAPTYLSNIDHANETESETDSYMDAVNTIESECENDLDCHMKCEVEQCSSSVDNCRVEDRIHEHVGHSSDQYPSSTESRTVADLPSTNGVSCNFPNSVPSGSSFHEQTPENFGKSSALDNSSGTDVCGNVVILDGLKVEPVTTDVQKVESVISDPSSSSATISNIRGQSGDRIKNGFPKHDELSSVTPVMFWTNGGLLGLEPSKPPDFALSNAGSLNDVVRSKSAPQDTIPKTDGLDGKLEALVENAESYEKFSGASFGKIPVSLADPDSKLEKSGASQINRSNHGSLYLTVVAASETELASDVKASPAEANQDCNSNSSIVFGLGHRFLTNGFHHRLSLAHDDNPIPVGSLSNGVFDRGSGHYHEAYQTVSETAFTERFGCGSPLGSLTSSPPLEHMKISFNPVYGSDTSKLKLKIPDGSRFPESGRDMFPSFQLVPERAIPLRGYGTDSDDDTFCRSSPYMSDDCPSHHSESNSEQWESSPGGSNDHDLYDDLCRMPPLESLSSTLQPERAGKHADRGVQKVATENGAEPGLPSFDLPSFDAARPALQEDLKTDCDPHNITELRNSKDPRPLPPPLPPMQWRVPKPLSDVAEDKQFSVPALRHELEEKLSVSTLSQQCELAVDRELTNKEAVAFTRESKDQPKLNGRKEVHQNANGKGVDEKEDFLHQIRTKSFSLRPTVTARSAFSSAPSANVKVTAILEKASAIRQAVASDDGEGDDTWSDT